jgi:transcriptional regulator of acetoin/glycerol metabolism
LGRIGAFDVKRMRSLFPNDSRYPHHVDPRTLPPSTLGQAPAADARPGLVLVFAGQSAEARAFALEGNALELGRGTEGDGMLDDGRVSRRHTRVTFEDGRFFATDLASQNGTFVDGQQIAPNVATPLTRALKLGDSVLVPCGDIGPFLRLGVQIVDGFVRGPAMQLVLEEIARAAQIGSVLHVRGETGTGKEGAAAAFHRSGPRANGPLVAVNCAAIPQPIAERLLFGAKRGTYSGADQDASGYLLDADGGTLFLDEIAELDAQVQAKLLRVLESREVVALGTSKPRRIELGLCSATNKDLRTLVASGTLREDLYFRIGTPAITLPPLRNRPEEIAALVVAELARLALTAHASLVELCLLRPWPGNIRELLAELRAAAQTAHPDTRVLARHLAAAAGNMFSSTDAPLEPPGEHVRKRMPQTVDDEWRARIENALRANDGKVAAAARSLGLHRTQLRRLIERHGIEVSGDDT